MTLQQAKDKVAQDDGHITGWDMDYEFRLNMISMRLMMEKAAELYARSKWKEACIACNDSVVNYYVTKKTRIHDDVTAYFVMQAPKPEFKP